MDRIGSDIIVLILTFIPRIYWFKVKMTCKKFLICSKSAFDLSIYASNDLIWSIEKGRLECVKDLLKNPGIDPILCEDSAIRQACNRGYFEIVKELLKDPRVDPSASGNYCLRISCERGYVKIVRILIKDQRVDPIYAQNTPITNASINGHFLTVRTLMKNEKIYKFICCNASHIHALLSYPQKYNHRKTANEFIKYPQLLKTISEYYTTMRFDLMKDSKTLHINVEK